MSGKNKLVSPALGLVFGAGAGLLVSILCSFSIAMGIVFGTAIGLIIGAIITGFTHKKNDNDS
jgi:hypothetical protein